MFARNAFGSQRMSCISESHSTFWYWDYTRGVVSKMQQCQVFDLPFVGLGDGVCDWSQCRPGAWLSDTPHGACRWLTALRVRVQHRNDRGQGQRVGSRGAGTHIGTWKDQQQYLSRALHFFFKAREGLHILTFFPLSLFLFGGFGPVFEKKSFWGINT